MKKILAYLYLIIFLGSLVYAICIQVFKWSAFETMVASLAILISMVLIGLFIKCMDIIFPPK